MPMRGELTEATWEWNPDNYVPPRYRRPCSYSPFLPTTLEHLPPLRADVAGAISAAEDAIRRLNGVAQPGLQPLARLLLRSESIASSKVEGMQMDARSLARAEARSDLGQTVSREASEILANIDAMQLAVGDAVQRDAVTVDDVLTIHRALMERTVSGPRIAGVVRDRQNWIGGNDFNPCGAAFVPPTPAHVARLLDDLAEFCNRETLPPLAQAALAHAQFETIHPFEDGNGRTGRALVQVLLRRRAIAPDYVPPISIVLAADKQRYIDGLVAFRLGEENDWLQVFAEAAARAAELAAGYLVRVQELQQSWRDQLAPRKLRSDSASWLIIDGLPAHPIISVPVAAEAIGRSRPVVGQAVDVLVDAGVLIPLTSGSRNRQWEAAGLLELAAEFEDVGPR
jgi:Fic family protein